MVCTAVCWVALLVPALLTACSVTPFCACAISHRLLVLREAGQVVVQRWFVCATWAALVPPACASVVAMLCSRLNTDCGRLGEIVKLSPACRGAVQLEIHALDLQGCTRRNRTAGELVTPFCVVV